MFLSQSAASHFVWFLLVSVDLGLRIEAVPRRTRDVLAGYPITKLRFYEPDHHTPDETSTSDLDLLEKLLAESKRRGGGIRPWDSHLDYLEFLLGDDLNGPVYDFTVPFYKRIVPGRTREMSLGNWERSPFGRYSSGERPKQFTLRRRKRSQGTVTEETDERTVDSRTDKQNESQTGERLVRSKVLTGREAHNGAWPFQLTDTAAGMRTKRQRFKQDFLKSSSYEPQHSENFPVEDAATKDRSGGEFHSNHDLPVFEDFLLGKKRSHDQTVEYDFGAKKPLHLNYEDFLFGEKRSQQQKNSRSNLLF